MPLLAAAVIAFGIGVLVMVNYLKRTAGSGCVARLVLPLYHHFSWEENTLKSTHPLLKI